MNIVIPDDYQNIIADLECFKMLNGHHVTIYNDTLEDVNALVKRFINAQVIILTRERTAITESLVSQLPGLKLISQTGKISNHLDLNACTKYKIAVAEGQGSPVAPSELAWILIMNAYRKIPQAIQFMKEGYWQQNIGSAINGKSIGIWGYGKIGKRVAKYAKAFDAHVIIWGSENSRNGAKADGFRTAENKEEFFL